MKAPIALFVYNRAEHAKRTIRALCENYDIENAEVYIFADGAKDATEIAAVEAVRDYLSKLQENHPFHKLAIRYQETNRGLEASIIGGVTELMNRYGKAIVLEDDIITSPDFYHFMNAALDAYEKDEKVWSVSGYSLETEETTRSREDVLWTWRGGCWGWGSWKNRWDTVDWKMGDYAAFSKSRRAQRSFNRGGRDMAEMLRKQQTGEVHSWAIRWCYQQFKEDRISVFPKHPKAYNIGFDGSGTNCSAGEENEAHFTIENAWDFRYSLKNKSLSNAFRKMYHLSYLRQKLGAIWYLLTEYEYCIAYRKGNAAYKVLKPNYKDWYADPIPFRWNGVQYVFVECFHKFQNRGGIGVCRLEESGVLSRPRMVIEESFHLSFPYIFSYAGSVYMIPESSASGQIRIYQMGEDIYHWMLYGAFDDVGEIVDSVTYQDDDGRLYLLGSRVAEDDKLKTRLVLYEIRHLEQPSAMELQFLWAQSEDSYFVRNGGSLLKKQGRLLRIAQQSTSRSYGRNVVVSEVDSLDETGLREHFIEKKTLHSEGVKLTPFLYRQHGIHTYGETGDFQVIDLHVQRFSLGGLFLKLWRRIVK